MEQSRLPFWRRHRLLVILAGVFFAVVAVLGTVLAVLAHHFEPFLRTSLVEGLETKFHTRVELDGFHVALGNGLEGEWGIWATGHGLRIWPPRQTGSDHPLEVAAQPVPLISLDQFRFHVPLRYRQGQPIKIARVRLSGLKIVVPPRAQRDKAPGTESDPAQSKPSTADSAHSASSAPTAVSNGSQPGTNPSNSAGILSNVVVQRIECDHTELILETNKPNKLPLAFVISRLNLTHVTANGAMGFDAELTNPKPQGLIHSKGSLGPWQTIDPGETPISGTYTFDHADLSTFKGIAGILASTGRYTGTLRDLVVDGTADVPDFRLPHFGNPESLHTQFHAKVDGTDGDTWLDPVDATLGHSHFTARGQVVRIKPANAPDQHAITTANFPPLADFGHLIDLKVDVDRGHIEDFLRLANRSPSPTLTGTVVVKASLHILPGKTPVHERMQLDGAFKLDQVHFTSEKIQNRIKELSLRGQGHPDAVKTSDADSIISEMHGEFHMAKGVIALPDIRYNVPGAAIQLQGSYPLEGFMQFEGTARMQATVSQMVGGWKGFLLKPADRFFKKDGSGTVVPIRIRGPHDAPEFGVDFGRMKHTTPETPGKKQ